MRWSFKIASFLGLFLFTMLSGIFSLKAEQIDIDYSSLNWIEDRVYFDSDQFILSKNGIFVLIPDSNGLLAKVLVSQINFDTTGLFVLAEHLPSPQMDFCRYGHPACKKCGRCNTPGCPTPPCRCNFRK